MSVPSAVFSAQPHLRRGFNALLLSTLLLALPAPAMADDERLTRLHKWQRAVERSRDWSE